MNRPLLSIFAALAVGAVVSSQLAGCGDHLTTQEATSTCLELSKKLPGVSGKVLDACVACYENCEDCQVQGTSPETFACPGDSDETTSSSSSGAGGSGS